MLAETVCRVCLVNNLNLYGVQNDLQNAYEIITREKYNKVGYPVSLCYICLSMLKKCYKFMETARDTDNMLKQWCNHHNEVQVGLAKPLKIYCVSKIEFVYMGTKHVSLTNGIKTEAANIENIQPHSDITETARAMENEDISLKDNIKMELIDFEEVQSAVEETSTMKSIANDVTTVSLRHNLEKERDLEPVGVTETMEFMENEDTSLEHDIKMEEVDLEPDNIECDTDDDVEKAATDAQTDSNDLLTVACPNDDTTQCKVGIDTNSFIDNNDIEQRSILASNMNVCTNVETGNKTKSQHNSDTTNEVRLEEEKNNVMQFLSTHDIPKDLNTDIKIEEMYENDTDILVTSNKNVNLSNDVLPPKNTQKPEDKSNTNNKFKQQSNTFIFCNYCNFKCVAKSVLIGHLRSHTGEKPFSCNFCLHKCAKKDYLKKHILRKHNGAKHGDKPYSCKFCKYRCAQKQDLKMHSKKHIGDKPISCEFCEYRCKMKCQLRKHLKIHSDTVIKPYSCTLCNYRSAKKSSMTEHLRMHTGDKPFSCDICEFKCTQKSYLNIHLRKHTGDKPYSCTFCDYKSTRKGHLTEHLRTHTGDKPFSCKFCDYKSVRNSDLNKHLNSHH